MPELDLRAFILFFAIVLDWILGDPKQIYRHVMHPVQFMGALLGWFEGKFNRPGLRFGQAKRRGVLVLFTYLFIWVVFAVALSFVLSLLGVWGPLVTHVFQVFFYRAAALCATPPDI